VAFFLLILVVVLLDQITKFWIVNSFNLYETREIIPGFFNLVYCTNSGAAFSILAGPSSLVRQCFFIVVTIIALVFVISLYRKHREQSKLYLYGFGLIAGGAVGNLIDRLRHGAVIDFLDFYIGYRHWPAFNLADSAITIGTGLIMLVMFVSEKSTTKTNNTKE